MKYHFQVAKNYSLNGGAKWITALSFYMPFYNVSLLLAKFQIAKDLLNRRLALWHETWIPRKDSCYPQSQKSSNTTTWIQEWTWASHPQFFLIRTIIRTLTLYSTMTIAQLWSRKAQCNHVSSFMWHIISAGNLHNTLFSYNFTFSLSSTFIWVFCFNLKNRKSRGRSLTTCIEAYIHLHLKTVKYHLSFRIQYLMAMRFLHTK